MKIKSYIISYRVNSGHASPNLTVDPKLSGVILTGLYVHGSEILKLLSVS